MVQADGLGDSPPLLGGSGRRPPDRRRVSLRWMAGSILTGMTSLLLMGGALHAAFDGRQQLARPASVMTEAAFSNPSGSASQRGDRPIAIPALEPASEKVLQVPTVTRVGNANVIRKKPFAYASAPLAVLPERQLAYPKFDPLAVFRASTADRQVASSDVIYGADIESEVVIEQTDFPLSTARFDTTTQISSSDAEKIVAEARESLADGITQLAALPYLDPTRFALSQEEIAPPSALDIRIVAENVSRIVPSNPLTTGEPAFGEDVVAVPDGQGLEDALKGLQLNQAANADLVSALLGELGTDPLSEGTRIRIAWKRMPAEGDGGSEKFAQRISVYRSGAHLRSVARNDEGRVVWANAPAPIPAVQIAGSQDREEIATVSRANLPTVYDGLYRAALSQGLNKAQSRRIVRTVAFDVDFRNRVSPSDQLEVFYSLEDGQTDATSSSEILYIGLTIGGVKRDYYRFRADDDGSVDYYDANGRSAKKFLLRKPVPNGRFRSPFGMRRHPISRVYKMHNGVDFSAPRGTPIIAAGNGVIEKMGWAGGYGRQLVIRHANGYRSHYNHMHRFAKGLREGVRVSQGQIIGQVGSTGYSTGPHLHYEVSVNKRKVNPMKIRLPEGRSLSDSVLAAFQQERDRIDALLDKGRGTASQTVAAIDRNDDGS